MKGKTPSDNKRNFLLWKDNCPMPDNCTTYNPCVNYPGKVKSLFRTPQMKPGCKTTDDTSDKIILFQRHAFSCANLAKANGLVFSMWEDTEDPSLTTYGILSTLSLDRTSIKGDIKGTPVFERRAFVSPLIRTWQTAIVEFAPLFHEITPSGKVFKEELELTIAPFIIEGGWGKSNTPLDENAQRYKMSQFMILLQNIFTKSSGENREKLNRILSCTITIKKEERIVYQYKKRVFEPSPDSIDGTGQPVLNIMESQADKTQSAHLFRLAITTFNYNPRTIDAPFNAELLPLPRDDYITFYDELAFGYFYQWVQKVDYKNIFVVCHGNVMKGIMKAYSHFSKEDTEDYFDENLWRFQVDKTRVVLSHGIKKPTVDSLYEPLCYRTVTKTQRAKGAQIGQAISTQPILPSEPPFTPSPPQESPLFTPSPPQESPLFTPSPPQQSPPFTQERTPPPLPPRPLKAQLPFNPSGCQRRSYEELIPLLHKYLANLFAFINSPASQDKEQTKEFIRANPEFFQNHIICVTLFHIPIIEQLINVKIKKIYSYAKYAPSLLVWGTKKYLKRNYESRFPGISTIPLDNMNLDNVVRFLNKLLEFLQAKDMIDLLIDICLPKANYSYFYKERTQQELAQEVEEDAIEGGGIFSWGKKTPSPEIIHCFTLLDFMVFRAIEFHFYDPEQFSKYIKIINTLINNGARFSRNGDLIPLNKKKMEKYEYVKEYVIDILSRIPHYKEFFLNEPAITTMVQQIQLGAGTRRLKGTSSTKTSLRRPLVKRATRRALRYKGRKRSKVNRY